MSTKRQVIDSLRDKLRERNTDSRYTNQFLYSVLLEHAKWLIKREVQKGRVYTNSSFFQTLGCMEVIETSTIDECCPIKTNCKIYRTKCKIPDLWVDTNGPIIKQVTSVDNTTDFLVTTAKAWLAKRTDPYEKLGNIKYSFYSDGYIWFPEYNPHRINVYGFYTDDISALSECSKTKKCVRFLDTKFMIPEWLEAELQAKALEQIAGISKRINEDNDINKNPSRKD